jgi:hypothetical protein
MRRVHAAAVKNTKNAAAVRHKIVIKFSRIPFTTFKTSAYYIG